jgi:hypothetical protein
MQQASEVALGRRKASAPSGREHLVVKLGANESGPALDSTLMPHINRKSMPQLAACWENVNETAYSESSKRGA